MATVTPVGLCERSLLRLENYVELLIEYSSILLTYRKYY